MITKKYENFLSFEMPNSSISFKTYENAENYRYNIVSSLHRQASAFLTHTGNNTSISENDDITTLVVSYYDSVYQDIIHSQFLPIQDRIYGPNSSHFKEIMRKRQIGFRTSFLADLQTELQKHLDYYTLSPEHFYLEEIELIYQKSSKTWKIDEFSLRTFIEELERDLCIRSSTFFNYSYDVFTQNYENERKRSITECLTSYRNP